MVLFSLLKCVLFLYLILQAVHRTIVVEGGSARFECGYSGQGMIVWRVNNFEYTPPARPEKHSLNSSDDRIMMLRDADSSMNGSTYQCKAELMTSSTVILFVLPATPIIIITSILAPMCFMLGCGTCGVLILITRYNHRKEVTEIQTNRNEAYQTVSEIDQQPEVMPQNPIYEHVA